MSLHIILTSHGNFALESLKTAEMIIGMKQEHVDVVSVLEGRSYDDCLKELQDKHQAVKDKVDGVIILADIFGGTPSNISSYLALTNENIQVYSGLNIPILLELLLTKPDTIEKAKQVIENAFSNSLTDITQKIKEVNDDGDNFDSY